MWYDPVFSPLVPFVCKDFLWKKTRICDTMENKTNETEDIICLIY